MLSVGDCPVLWGSVERQALPGEGEPLAEPGMSSPCGSGAKDPWKEVIAVGLYSQLRERPILSVFRYLNPKRKSLPTWQCLVCTSSAHSQASP